MSLKKDVYYLNTRHSRIINEFMSDIQDLVQEVTLFNEDYNEFLNLSSSVIDFHNGLSEYIIIGGVNSIDWYVSLPNNLYWTTKGYLSSINANQEIDLVLYEEKLLSLTVDVISKLHKSFIIQPFTDKERNINLN